MATTDERPLLLARHGETADNAARRFQGARNPPLNARGFEQAGYIRGTVTNSPDQSRSATIVAFREGSRADALQVARQIGAGEDAVQPLDPSDAVTAGEEADVVVIVGADRTDLP